MTTTMYYTVSWCDSFMYILGTKARLLEQQKCGKQKQGVEDDGKGELGWYWDRRVMRTRALGVSVEGQKGEGGDRGRGRYREMEKNRETWR